MNEWNLYLLQVSSFFLYKITFFLKCKFDHNSLLKIFPKPFIAPTRMTNSNISRSQLTVELVEQGKGR